MINSSSSRLKVFCNSCLRTYASTKKKKVPKHYEKPKDSEKGKNYRGSVLLPRTEFPVWLTSAERATAVKQVMKSTDFSNLYSWQRENVKGDEFILHDGPPYANGAPHMGHAINKILKDITIRNKLLQGHKIHYKPGWDCHGLPIELKATAGSVAEGIELSDLEIRDRAKKFAEEAIKNQRVIFESWGVMANWENDCYFTFDKNYMKNEMNQFFNLYESGFVYQDYKPVYWSPSSKTALAEAELEYKEQHVSPAIFIAFELSHVPEKWQKTIGNDAVSALIWTTTPWTLPANQAVAFNPTFKYSLVRVSGQSGTFLVAKDLIQFLSKKFKETITVVIDVPCSEFQEIKYRHPFDKSTELRFLQATYVTSDKGTGFVHTAPAHGQDDFLLGLKNNLELVSFVDEEGCFTEEVGPELSGLYVLTEGNDAVLALLENQIIKQEKYVHSYPYDWRTHEPVILRASRQWFIDTSSLKDKALDALKNVKILPDKASNGFFSLVQHRPYWCISRQRLWGIPIPVVYNTATEKPVISRRLIDHYQTLIDKHGSNFWWSLAIDELVPKEIREELGLDVESLEKGKDILDIWLDSGLSWSHVLGEEQVADIYMEGVDQFTGWFQSSLMTSIALRGVAPYKMLLAHGFAVDEEGKKMSKSLGNVVSPQDIVSGGVDAKKQPGYGVDVLRWWVAAHSLQHARVPVSSTHLSDSQQCVKKLRLLLKFALGVINDLPSPMNRNVDLFIIDQYMMHLLYNFHNHAQQLYNNYEYNKVCAHIVNFVTNDISAFYCHLVKDRLYCDEEDSDRRRAAQLTMDKILQVISRVVAPILPILAEEVYLYHPSKTGKETVFKSDKICDESWINQDVEDSMKLVLDLKKQVLKETPINAQSLELVCEVSASPSVYNLLRQFQNTEKSSDSQLVEILQVSSVSLTEHTSSDELFSVRMKSAYGITCVRCRRNRVNVLDEDLCQRCLQVLDK
ncbi:isoleucine--tRNA ligase, mitochondrial [Nilaparvata lugens]|uniref:isoleucine--tRNA ligase, mitochondrial n=1 Tax=Nilaparvata lugens TaxID=108931 RepID=UPI00193D4207|nr:isoleucine--tRNA ligase, mitochondrial [Nilaparvata lugens]